MATPAALEDRPERTADEFALPWGERWANRIPGIVSVGAGGYLLSSQAVGDNSYLELLAHGIGVYFVARGIGMWRSLHYSARQSAHSALQSTFLAELLRRGR